MRPWHAEAIKLRKDGWSTRAIAEKVGRSASTVRWALNESGEREKTANRVSKQRGCRPRQALPNRKPATKEDAKRAAILAFARHEIDRTELMARITP